MDGDRIIHVFKEMKIWKHTEQYCALIMQFYAINFMKEEEDKMLYIFKSQIS